MQYGHRLQDTEVNIRLQPLRKEKYYRKKFKGMRNVQNNWYQELGHQSEKVLKGHAFAGEHHQTIG